jgi:small ligand-binding sensory domain FIST
MPFAAALSEHPIAVHATGEVVGSVLDELGGPPDVATLFVTGAHVGAFEDIAAAVQQTLRPRAFIGATAVSVLGGAREVEEQPAVSLWAGPVPGCRAVRLNGFGDDLPADGTALVLADPTSFPVADFLERTAQDRPDLTVIGGVASAGFAPGANRLTVDGITETSGAAALFFDRDVEITSVVSQGCRPIGDPLTVTRAEGNIIREIAGKPALARLEALLGSLDEDELAMARQGLHVGRVIDEHKADFGRGDFLIRNVLGGDREVGAIAIGEEVSIGDTVQFQLRDAASADEDLRLLLDGHQADGAIVFTCNGRGYRLFGEVDHDAAVVSRAIGNTAVAGMFCAGEIGPVGGRSFLHGFTASVALFGQPDR